MDRAAQPVRDHLSDSFPTPRDVFKLVVDLGHVGRVPGPVPAAGEAVLEHAAERGEDAIHGGVPDHDQPPPGQALVKASPVKALQLAPARAWLPMSPTSALHL